jgi:adrenodoxin-NADP+ reductase
MAPFKLAIIGAGPSAFYVASRLLALVPYSSTQSPQFKIHMYDRLWAPHGLVRYGVAPDHPEVKVRLLVLPSLTDYFHFARYLELYP